MTDKICTNGHVFSESRVTCDRCGGSEQLSNNQNIDMENEENKNTEETVEETKTEEVTGNAPTESVEEKTEGESNDTSPTEASSEETIA